MTEKVKINVPKTSAEKTWGLTSKLIIAATGFIALLLLLAAFGPYLISTSSYRDWLQNAVQEKFDAHVIVEKMNLRLIPYPGFTIKGLELVSKNYPFQGLSIFKADTVRGSLSLSDLIHGKVVTSIDAKGVTADLRIADGAINLKNFTNAPSAEKSQIEIKSAKVSEGKLGIWQENTMMSSLEGVTLSLRDLPYDDGLGADINLTGYIIDHRFQTQSGHPPKTDLQASGKLFIARNNKALALRGCTANLSGTHLTFEASLDSSAEPISFDIHLASPDVRPGTLVSLLPETLNHSIPDGIWQGLISIDVAAKGDRETFMADVSLDATTAKIETQKLISKPHGLTLKSLFELSFSPENIALQNGSITLGDREIKISGNISRDSRKAAHLNISGDDISDSTLKLIAPKISLFNSITGMNFSADLEGIPVSDNPFSVKGFLTAKNVQLAGISFVDLECSFERATAPAPFLEAFNVPNFKTAYAGGQVSGNGYVKLGDTDELGFDAVADRIDAGTIEGLRQSFSGLSSIVVKFFTTGTDATSLIENSNFKGSFVMQSGSWSKAKPFSSLFTDETWAAIETSIGAKLTELGKNKLSSAGTAIYSLNASFSIERGKAEADPVTWKNSAYEVFAKGAMDSTEMVGGSGDVIVNRDVSSQLVPPPQQKNLLDNKGRLVLPVVFKGKPDEIQAIFDRAKFEDSLKLKDLKPPLKPQAIKEETKATPKKDQVKRGPPLTEKKAGSVPKQKPEKRLPAETPQSEDDVLKVIIGQ